MLRVRQFFCFVILLSFLVIGYFHPLNAINQDLGRHLLTGKTIVTTHQITSVNLYSYTYPNFPFINHHYGSEVIFYLFTQVFGLASLLFLGLFLVISAWILSWQYAGKQHYSLLAILATSILYTLVLFERTDIRPELFGYTLLSLFIVILFTYRQRFTRLIYLLPLLQLVWTQLHISFVIGPAVLVLFYIDNLIIHRHQLNTRSFRVLTGILIATLLTTIINPYGLKGALYPLQVFNNYGYTIEENQTIFFLDKLFFKPTILYFKIAVVTLFVLLLTNRKQTRPIDWLMATFFSVLGASAVRHFPLFVFATFIPLVHHATILVTKLKTMMTPAVQRYTQLSTLVLSLIFIVWQSTLIVQTKGFGMGTTAKTQAGVDFYLQHQIQGPIFNNFDVGSYLEYRIYPPQQVFVDGRPEAYPAAFFYDVYIPMQENPDVFAKIDKQYHFNAIFFTHTDQTPWAQQFLNTIIRNPEWHLVYLDDTVIILLKDTPANKALIATYGKPLENITLPPTPLSLQQLLQYANFFSVANLPSPAIETFKRIIEKDPHHCPSLYYLALYYSQKDGVKSTQYSQQFQQFCK